VDGHRIFGLGGSTLDSSASYQRLPDKELGVILLTNTDQQTATTLARKIATFNFRKN
jgi:hypothetical protein